MLTILVRQVSNILCLFKEKKPQFTIGRSGVLLNAASSLKQCSLAEYYSYAVLDHRKITLSITKREFRALVNQKSGVKKVHFIL